MADDKSKDATKTPEPAAAGGLKAMVPLIITVVLMPILALGMTKFVLLPGLQKAIVASATTLPHAEGGPVDAPEAGSESGSHGESPASGKGGETGTKPPAKGAKATWTLPKVIVNVGGTQATRYLMSSYTLVGKGDDFKSLLEANVDQIRDVTSGVLGVKTIQDLEKADARAVIKSELISSINTALGKPAVQEIYITEFAIQ